jgi:hypothetical protein
LIAPTTKSPVNGATARVVVGTDVAADVVDELTADVVDVACATVDAAAVLDGVAGPAPSLPQPTTGHKARALNANAVHFATNQSLVIDALRGLPYRGGR